MGNEILIATLPALLVAGAVLASIQVMLKKDKDIRRSQILMANQKTITPIRLQAYERIILLLERLGPESLVMRTMKKDMTVRQLQNALLTTIRQEYEHNLSQQIYMSPEAWSHLKNAKENLTQLINVAAMRLKPESPAMKLSTAIIEMHSKAEEQPLENAIAFIKKEINNFMDTRNNFY